jgi:DNA-binding protein H-NS
MMGVLIMIGGVMKRSDFESLSIDELWALREDIVTVLSAKMLAEQRMLEDRLRKLDGQTPTHKTRRPYPTVHPKYRNPNKPFETWSGRGKRPRWLTAALRSGKRLDDFRI